MKLRKSQPGAVVAAGYLLLVFAAASPLVRDGYVGHGNGLEFLAATILTFPLSMILFLLNDLIWNVNAFHMTGWPYFLTLCELGAGGLLNAVLIYVLVERLAALYRG